MKWMQRSRAPEARPAAVALAGRLPWLLAVSAVFFFLVVAFLPALTNFRHGFPTYYVSARLVWEGRWSPRVYDNAWFSAEVAARTPNAVGEVYAPNPPTTSLLLLPLAWLDIVTARQAWLWLNLGLLLFTAAVLSLNAPAERPWVRAAVWALPFVLAPVHENFRLANVYVLLLALFALALRQAGRAYSGVPLGLAAGLKLSGSPLWLWMAARGRWQALAVAASVGVALFALSLPYAGMAGWQRFAAVLVEHADEPGWAAGLSFQTTPSFFQHMFRPDARWNPQPLWVLPAWVARGCALLVTALALGAWLWRTRSTSPEVAFAAAAALSVVVLPFAEEYHYALLVLPLGVAASRVAGRPRWHAAMLLLSLVLLALPWPYKDPWFNDGWHALLGYPRLYGGWLLWAWLMAVRS